MQINNYYRKLKTTEGFEQARVFCTKNKNSKQTNRQQTFRKSVSQSASQSLCHSVSQSVIYFNSPCSSCERASGLLHLNTLYRLSVCLLGPLVFQCQNVESVC